MSRHLPPLPAVRAFEAAARLGGFARASGELCVSPGAVAHQIKQLEEWLGFELFVRQPRSVELTEPGRRFFATAQAVLDELAAAASELRRWAGDKEVTVSAMPSLVTRWLMPRLGRFRERFPEVEVRVLASVPPVDFVRDRVDVAIRLGAGPYPDMDWVPLLEERFYPVCSPAFLGQHDPLAAPADLLELPLLHDEYEARIPQQVSWARWFAAHGISLPSQRVLPGNHYSHTYLTLDAAAGGQGVAMASDVLAFDAVRAGILRIALDASVLGPYRYHLLRHPASMSKPAVRSFCDWLLDEATHFKRRKP